MDIPTSRISFTRETKTSKYTRTFFCEDCGGELGSLTLETRAGVAANFDGLNPWVRHRNCPMHNPRATNAYGRDTLDMELP